MYEYTDLKPRLFTDEGQRNFLKVRDHVCEILKKAGAVSMGKAISVVTGDNWVNMACVDRLVELGEIKEIDRGPDCPGQYRLFVKIAE